MATDFKPDRLKFVGINIVTLLKELRGDEKLMKLLLSNKNRPLEDESITEDVIRESTSPEKYTLSPFPFDEHAQTTDTTQLRVYAMNNYFTQNEAYMDTSIVFEIMVPKSQWLIWNEEGKSTIRPYEMAARITNIFNGKKLEGLGDMAFTGFSHISVGTSFEGIRVFGQVWSVEKSGANI